MLSPEAAAAAAAAAQSTARAVERYANYAAGAF